jgi:superfamily II DNA or RNA helicase
MKRITESYTLHDFQSATVADAVRFIKDRPEERRMYASPTGTGKSVIELATQDEIEGCWLITPSLEIISDMLHKRTGMRITKPSVLLPRAMEGRISTPVRFRNMLLQGLLNPQAVIFDEGHHALAETYEQICILVGDIPKLIFTATPYRGTAKGTCELIRKWGEPIWAILLTDAIKRNLWKMPDSFETYPLIDDDLIEISNGEFVVDRVRREVESKIRDIGNLIIERGLNLATMVAIPTRENVYALHDYLSSRGFPSDVVTDSTKTTERHKAFERCVNRESVLLQIKAVSEGNDLKVRRLIDCTPSLSPNFFMQRFGRITRPTSERSEYVCTNRNLLRFAYLFEGNLPVYEYKKSEEAFPTPTKRMGIRAWDIESLGKFKPSKIKFQDGMEGEVYSIQTRQEGETTEFTALVHPLCDEVIWGKRINKNGRYGRFFRLTEPPASVKGFASKSGNVLTPKQTTWFKEEGGKLGLDVEQKLDRRAFDAFVLLQNLKVRIKTVTKPKEGGS